MLKDPQALTVGVALTHTRAHTHAQVSRSSPRTAQHSTLRPCWYALLCPSASNSPNLMTVFFSDLQAISFNLGTIRGRSRRHLILIRSREMARGTPTPNLPGPSLHVVD